METVINPKTNRPIIVGGKVWRKLVKENMIQNSNYKDPRELGEIPQDESKANARIAELNEELPDSEFVARGSGRYKDKLVKKQRKIKKADAVAYTSKIASKIVSENKDNMAGYDSEELELELEKLILAEMTAGRQPAKQPRKKLIPRVDANLYEEVSEAPSEEFSESE